MTGIALASVFTALVIGVLWLQVRTRRDLRVLQRTVDGVRSDTATLLAELREAVADASPPPTDDEEATPAKSTVAPASRLAYSAFGDPVIKALALRAGTSRAVQRLRSSTSNGNGNGARNGNGR